MKTILTNLDIKNIFNNIFNNKEYDEPISLNENGIVTTVNIIEYLNIKFYAWKNRLIEKSSTFTPFESWLDSLNYSLNESYALVETQNTVVLPSKDIDNATISGKVTFLMQTNKVALLDYYATKVRNAFLGVPQDIQNSYGEKLKAYITIGTLLYDEEPQDTQFGECLVVSLNFNIVYLTEALSYADMPIELSLDGQNYYELPYLNCMISNIFTGEGVTKQSNPTVTGALNSSVTQGVAFSYYDFNKTLTNKLDEIFWSIGQVETDLTPNIPVFMRVTVNGKVYNYKYLITSMQKDIKNGEFSTSSIVLKTWGLN